MAACHPELVEGRAQRPTHHASTGLSMTPFLKGV